MNESNFFKGQTSLENKKHLIWAFFVGVVWSLFNKDDQFFREIIYAGYHLQNKIPWYNKLA